jgi:hypothetical protein
VKKTVTPITVTIEASATMKSSAAIPATRTVNAMIQLSAAPVLALMKT